MKTKDVLNEWKSYLNKELLAEVSIKRFQEQYPDFDISSFNSQLRGNTDYLDIISNTINSGEQHGPDDYIQQFEFYKNSIEPNRKDQEFLTINIPGGESVSLIDKVNPGSCTATYDDIQQFQQARMFILGKGSKNKLAVAYEKVLNEANESDFELIADDSNWIVFYPKSIKGSIALARSYWDGSRVVYDKTFNPSKGYGQNTGVIKWCTSVSGSGNMFLGYHRNLNLHMYYCINKNLNIENNSDRKLCVSLAKVRGNVSYKDGSASVNADNNSLSEADAKNYLGDIYNLLVKDASQDKRLEIDVESYYKSISLDQYIIMRNANEENIEDFTRELDNILTYSKEADEIYIVAAKDSNEIIRKCVAKKFETPIELLEFLAKDESEDVRCAVASNRNTPLEILIDLINDKSANVKLTVINFNHNNKSFQKYLENEPDGNVIKKLADDKEENVREFVASRKYIFANDRFDDVVEKLSKDKSQHVLVQLAGNIKRQESLKEKHRQIIDKLALHIKKDVFTYFRKDNFKKKDLDELISKFISFYDLLEQSSDKIIKFIIKKSKEGVKISSWRISKILKLLLDTESDVIKNEKTQMYFAKLIAKSDYDSQRFLLEGKHTTKKVYMYIAKKTLPLKGMGYGLVYQNLERKQKTYEMLQDPEIAEMFVNNATLGLLRKVFDKITSLINLKNNTDDLDHTNAANIHMLSISGYNVSAPLSLEESIDLAIKAGPVLYNAVQNSSNAMSIKKNRLDFEKALKQQNLIESKRLSSSTISEKLLKNYINLILS